MMVLQIFVIFDRGFGYFGFDRGFDYFGFVLFYVLCFFQDL